jgi:hypothetical protein
MPQHATQPLPTHPELTRIDHLDERDRCVAVELRLDGAPARTGLRAWMVMFVLPLALALMGGWDIWYSLMNVSALDVRVQGVKT